MANKAKGGGRIRREVPGVAECRGELKYIEEDLTSIHCCYARDLRDLLKEIAQLYLEEAKEINAALRDKVKWETRLAKALARKIDAKKGK
jgi:hypothetical protein